MFASPLIFPTTSEMLIRNLSELQSAPSLCKALEDIDAEEKTIKLTNSDSEKLARFIETEYRNARVGRVAKIIISPLAAVGSFAFGILTSGIWLPATVVVPSLLCLGDTYYRWSFLVDRVNAQAKARGVGVSRIHRIQEKIDKIGSKIIDSIGEERIQLQKSQRGLTRIYEKFSKIYKSQSNIASYIAGHTTCIVTYDEDGYSEERHTKEHEVTYSSGRTQNTNYDFYERCYVTKYKDTYTTIKFQLVQNISQK